MGTELFTVVSGAYATVAEVAALPDLAREPDVFTDAMIEEGIEYAIELVENETGTSWIYREHVVTLDGDYRDIAYVGIPFLRTIESCTVDGETQDVDGWTVTDDGYVRRDDSAPFVSSIPGRNVSITVTAGATVTPPAEIKWAVRTLARWYVLRLVSRAPDNAIQLTNAEGSVMLAQPGKHGPTALPEVNAVLRRNNHRWPAVG